MISVGKIPSHLTEGTARYSDSNARACNYKQIEFLYCLTAIQNHLYKTQNVIVLNLVYWTKSSFVYIYLINQTAA